MKSLRCAHCGHSQEIHDITEYCGCAGKKFDGSACFCQAFVYPEPDRIETKPTKYPLFAPKEGKK